ncbi:VOC family protein [Sphingomonas sp. DG1-23]|uniref:VOC family protein n=1 Tax=Sphingomonas sp. DG1-23 TaxID=3068316 RepID=UPI00273E9A54|nr:VOC family protein [Sphingomonas sp. DG1-23]MDP5278683.1 VOC family protein [Sphingomonas sp. DG1-23]
MSRLRSIRLLVEDYPASYRFYSERMKLPVLYGDENGPYAEFGEEGEVSLSIFQKDMMLDVLKDEGGESDPADDFMLIFKADGTVDEESAELATHATPVVAPTDRAAWGVRAAQFRDPQGLLVEVNKGFDE